MPIEFKCRQCGKTLRTGDATAGKQARCPECGTVQPIPVADAGSPPPLPTGQDPGGFNINPTPAANPYAAPTAASSSVPAAGSSAIARSMVKGPSIALMVVAGIAILVALVCIVGSIANTINPPQLQGFDAQQQKIIAATAGPVGLVLYTLGLFTASFVVYGALKMNRLQSYTVSMVASILPMIPCVFPHLCCVVGLPIGIWSVVVLMNEQVKAGFTR